MEGIHLSELQNLPQKDQIEQEQLSNTCICHKINRFIFKE